MATEYIIIGGGIIGIMTALKLSEDSDSITLIDQSELGKESSWAGGGIISPLYPWRYEEAINQLAKFGQQCYPSLCQKLHNTTTIDPEIQHSGMLVITPNDCATAIAWAKQYQYNYQILKGAQLQSISQPITKHEGESIYFPEIDQVRNPRLMRSLKAYLSHKKISYQENTKVLDFNIKNGRINTLETNRNPITAKNFIICSGAWSAQLLAKLNTQTQVQPVKGQMILYRCPPDFIKPIILHNNHYIIPRRDGRILTGSTLEFDEFNKSTSKQALKVLKAAAEELIPALASYPIEHQWAGLRPGSPNGVPYIDKHPQYHNLFINCGHFRNGVNLAPGSAQVLSDIIHQRDCFINPDLFSFTAERKAEPFYQHLFKVEN